MNCEHELHLIEEEYLTNIEINITLECGLCKNKFKGIIKQDE